MDVPAFETGDSPHLIVTGQAQGSLESLDALFQQTPLKEKLPEELLDWRFRSGDLQGHLLLDFPLQKEAGEPAVLVRAQVDAGRIENPKRRLDLTEVSAPVFFHLRDGIQIETLKARTLGGQFSGQWLTRDGRSQLQLNGSLPMQQASRWLGFDWLRPLSGTLPLGLKIQVPWRGTPFSLQAASSMKGVAVAAPAPLGKSAGQTRPLDIRLAGEGRELGLRMQYGADLRARFRLGDRLGGDVLVGPGQLRAPGDGRGDSGPAGTGRQRGLGGLYRRSTGAGAARGVGRVDRGGSPGPAWTRSAWPSIRWICLACRSVTAGFPCCR